MYCYRYIVLTYSVNPSQDLPQHRLPRSVGEYYDPVKVPTTGTSRVILYPYSSVTSVPLFDSGPLLLPFSSFGLSYPELRPSSPFLFDVTPPLWRSTLRSSWTSHTTSHPLPLNPVLKTRSRLWWYPTVTHLEVLTGFLLSVFHHPVSPYPPLRTSPLLVVHHNSLTGRSHNPVRT